MFFERKKYEIDGTGTNEDAENKNKCQYFNMFEVF